MRNVATFFISDLHLAPQYEATTALFQRFLSTIADRAERLYILGDLFEVWLGIDAADDYQRHILQQLRDWSTRYASISIMPGNRDFLLDAQTVAAMGATYLSDPSVVLIDDKSILLCHGDALCTDDRDYQRYRRIIRHPLTQCLIRTIPASWRRRFAQKLRMHSQQANQRKQAYWMDVNEQTALSLMQENQTPTMIHGHTHKPAWHMLATQPYQRFTLGDWHDTAVILMYEKSRFQLVRFDMDSNFTLFPPT